MEIFKYLLWIYYIVEFFILTENFCHVTDKKMRADLGSGPSLGRSLPGQWLVTVGVSHHQLWVSRGLCHWRSQAEGLCQWCREWCCAFSEGWEVTLRPKKKTGIKSYHNNVHPYIIMLLTFTFYILWWDIETRTLINSKAKVRTHLSHFPDHIQPQTANDHNLIKLSINM